VRQSTLRRAHERDAGKIAHLDALIFPEAWKAQTIAEVLRDERTIAFVAECENDLCGYALSWTLCDEGELTRLAVAPEARGQGIGARMLESVLIEARARGANALFLEVRESNQSARRLYERAGFAEVGRRKNYYGDGESAIVMRK